VVPVAHIRKSDRTEQSLRAHLRAVAALCGHFASAGELRRCGILIGLLHDLGKYSAAFQENIRSKQDEAEALEVAATDEQHRVNHSAAGAQRLYELWTEILPQKPASTLLALLASPILSHHNPAGLVDFVAESGEQEPYAKRLSRAYDHTFLPEVRSGIKLSTRNFRKALLELCLLSKALDEDPFQQLLAAKFLYSCLIDADRTDSANFEYPSDKRVRRLRLIPNWFDLHQRFERTYVERYGAEYNGNDPVILVRRAISEACLAAATNSRDFSVASPGRVLSLPVPTGGGKTLASLRFALAHAAVRQRTEKPIRHIIYVLPFTTILVQNAQEARDLVGSENVLEHHANLLPSQINRRQIVLSENWDAPIIFTTTVQFLNAFYSDSKEAQRRMHQAASSILIFDEAQALPIKTLHLFNQAVKFLTRNTSSTAIICTATPPLLDKIAPKHGCLTFSPNGKLAAGVDVSPLLSRTQLLDKRKGDGSTWTFEELGTTLKAPLASRKHTLVIVNTKQQAQDLFDGCKLAYPDADVIHLSTNQCPAHLRDTIGSFDLDARRNNPDCRPLLCISTSMIEAGVDVDFDLVVRDIAGFVSIVQASGRCNRHGNRASGECWIVNLERKGDRPGLRDEIDATERVLREIGPTTPAQFSAACSLYFKYFYHEKKDLMLYPYGRTTLIDLLTANAAAVEEVMRRNGRLHEKTRIHSAPESAAHHFAVIDSATRGVMVPYSEAGNQVIQDFCSAFKARDGGIVAAAGLLARARPYTVNLYENDWTALQVAGALREVQKGADVYYLDERHYHPEKGVTIETSAEMRTLSV